MPQIYKAVKICENLFRLSGNTGRSTVAKRRRIGDDLISWPVKSFVFRVYIRLQVIHIFFESRDPLLCYFANCKRIIVPETLIYLDISFTLQFVELHTEVARCRAGLLLQVVELRLFEGNEQGDDSQPEL